MEKYKYKFSIIMSVYNVEKYIEEAIESVINQSIGFERNVQLILINDGSTDDSEEICKKYQKIYSENIIYKKQTNKGLSGARNTGLKYVQGKYVNFLDPDDMLSLNALEEVYVFFERNSLYIDMVTLPLYMFEKQTGLHPKYKFMPRKNSIINLVLEPHNFISSSAASFYKNSVINKMKFDETMYGSEDTKFNCEILSDSCKYGYVCNKGVKYHYRKRNEENSIVDSIQHNIQGFTSALMVFSTFDLDNLLSYQKEIIVYELRSRLRIIKQELFDEKEDYVYVIKQYKKYINLLSIEFILYQSKWLETIDQKVLFLNMKDKKYEDVIKSKNSSVSNLSINIKNYYIKKSKVIIEIIFYNFLYDDLDVIAYDGNNQIYNYVYSYDEEGPYDLYYGGFALDKTHYRRFEFDIYNPKTLRFAFINKKTKKIHPIKKIISDKFNKLNLHDAKIYLRYKNRFLAFNGRKFKISKTKISGIKYNLRSVYIILSKYKHLALIRLFNRRKKKYILINDRPNKAGDNGEALFKYIYSKRPDLAKYTYFVIDKKGANYNSLKKIGKVVHLRSVLHKILFLNSKYIYTSHIHRLFYNAFDLNNLKYYSDMFNYKLVWLQHGITLNNVSKSANKLNGKVDKIILSTKDEYNEISQPKYFYNGNVEITGMARFDFLYNNPQNIITICPTWRRNLTGKVLPNGKHEVLPNFNQTRYYHNYKKLLTNKKLKDLLTKHNFKLNFVLHPALSGYKKYFDELSNENINILSQREIVYNKVFSESKLLITDYSSVFFDFAYLKKPVIFFQFDQETFFKEHYSKGYFSYEKDGFGDVLTKSEDVVDKIEFYFKNGFKMEDKYINRVNKTFKYTDKNNCKRILDNTYRD